MKRSEKVQPKCRSCGAKVWLGTAGLLCDQCTARIIPRPVYVDTCLMPVDWTDVKRINPYARAPFAQPESLTEQNERLAQYGERQRPLFGE